MVSHIKHAHNLKAMDPPTTTLHIIFRFVLSLLKEGIQVCLIIGFVFYSVFFLYFRSTLNYGENVLGHRGSPLTILCTFSEQ